jgi:prepilin-type N-terminal cleavage/methylation domain-containing protein
MEGWFISKKKGFSLVEILIAVALAGILLVTLCGVFVQGLNAIKKGRFRSTAMNIADKKIIQVRRLVKSVGFGSQITGNEAYSIVSDGDDTSNATELKIGSSNVASGDTNTYEIWTPSNSNIYAHGYITIKGTARYEYKLNVNDEPYTEVPMGGVKKIRIEITWKEERAGDHKVVLESLVAVKKDWPLP